MDHSNKSSILVVEDTPEHAELIGASLENKYELAFASTMDEALKLLNSRIFDMVLLDLVLPDGDGYQICSFLRHHPELQDVPILILSSRHEVDDKVVGFTMGADDYITKPCDPSELRVRIESRLRRKPTTESAIFEGLHFNFIRHSVTIETEGRRRELDLTPREYKLLSLLARNPDTILSRDQILKSVWGEKVFVSDRSIDTHMASIRKKLGPLAHYIKSVHGTGYRFVPKPSSRVQKAA